LTDLTEPNLGVEGDVAANEDNDDGDVDGTIEGAVMPFHIPDTQQSPIPQTPLLPQDHAFYMGAFAQQFGSQLMNAFLQDWKEINLQLQTLQTTLQAGFQQQAQEQQAVEQRRVQEQLAMERRQAQAQLAMEQRLTEILLQGRSDPVEKRATLGKIRQLSKINVGNNISFLESSHALSLSTYITIFTETVSTF
ncbi:hypothetical protein BGZ99_001434, partial [Dissophora globulifera]